jgi:hypothetical protein
MTQRKLLRAGVALYYVAHKLASYNPDHKPRSYNPVKLWPRCRGRPVAREAARGRSSEAAGVPGVWHVELAAVPAVWHGARELLDGGRPGIE